MPGGRLPLFKFRELFENRFNGGTVTVADLNQMHEVVSVADDPLLGRSVFLKTQPSSVLAAQGHQALPDRGRNSSGYSGSGRENVPEDSRMANGGGEEKVAGANGLVVPPTAICFLHAPPEFCKTGGGLGWAEKALQLPPLPQVNISLKVLGPRVHSLLQSHEGVLPLAR